MCKQKLLSSIEQKRTIMIKIALNHGLDSQVAIEHSQELDRLLNLYDQLAKETNSK